MDPANPFAPFPRDDPRSYRERAAHPAPVQGSANHARPYAQDIRPGSPDYEEANRDLERSPRGDSESQGEGDEARDHGQGWPADAMTDRPEYYGIRRAPGGAFYAPRQPDVLEAMIRDWFREVEEDMVRVLAGRVRRYFRRSRA